jgi:heterodisulfide reductase subunit A-like polyferredoxin
MGIDDPKPGKIGSVMVAGAGIAGMQAALDTANSGLKVYLVEESAAIGGRMAQLDKTFPTNDCAMCTISPRLIEVDKHPNIEILTRATILSVEGEPGRFRARVLKSPQYVDLELCNACGDCVEVCPVDIENPYEQGLATRKAIYKKYPQAIPNVFAIDKNPRPPCVKACPAGVNCQGYVALASQGKFAEACSLHYKRNPFLSVCGRVCHNPCESDCYRGDYDEPVAIRAIKRFVGDWANEHSEELQQVFDAQAEKDAGSDTRCSENGKHRIAVVGSGPAGLSAALDLTREGYRVTIFEAEPAPGGMLRSGFPDYRLPKDIVRQEIQRILDAGVEIKLNVTVGKDITLDELKAQGFEAIFIAIGLQKGRLLKLEGSDLPGVLNGLDFLKCVNTGKPFDLGRDVVVIGGGNVAIDVAMTAIRSGAGTVKMVCLESREEMPAHSWEIEDALDDGIAIHNSWGPVRINGSEKITGLAVKRCIRVLDDSGRFSPRFDETTTDDISCDTVIFAIGQSVDREVVDGLGPEFSGTGATIKVDAVTLETARKGVFAGGDAIKTQSSVVEAVAFGHEAAESIDRHIHGIDMREGRAKEEEPAPKPERVVEQAKRVTEQRILGESRRESFNELSLTISQQEAEEEARRCLNCGICSECQQCYYTCQPNAIFHDRQAEIEEIDIGSLIIASGYEPFDARGKPEYGYGRYPNVLTSLEFERMLSASGPFGGDVVRPSDLKKPRNIAWIQCVGSRDQLCGNEYCSSVCCMYATKEAIVTREHNAEIATTIFYNDIRAFGKGFDRYYERAKSELDVSYVKCIVSSLKESPASKSLAVKFIDDRNEVREQVFDMVVLSVGIVPTDSTRTLFDRLRIKANANDFCESPSLAPGETNRPGIFVCGAAESPKDIPESIMQASCVAALSGEILHDVRGQLVSSKVYPEEREVENEEARVGVFICHCGTNIARVVDVESLTQFISRFPGVVHAEENLYTCSTDSQRKIIETIKEKGINRVVVSSCSPRTHEALFQEAIREAGLNRYLFEMANIRDQCSWVHAGTPELALDKAKDLVAMAIERAATLEPLQEQEYGVVKTGLVLGGGAAGMAAALQLANQGYRSFIVEKTSELGGNLRRLSHLLDGTETSRFLSYLLKRVEQHPNIEVYKNAEVVDFNGHVGDFATTIRHSNGGETEPREERLVHGVIIFAFGAQEHAPREYLYNESESVLTQLEFEELLSEDSETLSQTTVMIQCVGSREEPHGYCSRVCCQEAVKNALALLELRPEAKIYILYRDMRTYGFNELYYLKARQMGVTFIRFDAVQKPAIRQVEGGLLVRVSDATLGQEVEIKADRLVLSAGVRADQSALGMLQKFKVPVNEDGFLLEAHMKLRPLDFANEGMFMAGLAHGPKLLRETLAQARGAAARAMTILSKEKMKIAASIAVVDEQRCVACLTCVRNCPYDVPKLNEQNRAYIDPASCQGCGICGSACPAKAIDVQHYKDGQVLAKFDALELLKELERT